jgi:hypothetical protein
MHENPSGLLEKHCLRKIFLWDFVLIFFLWEFNMKLGDIFEAIATLSLREVL